MSSGFHYLRKTMDTFSAILSQQDMKPVKSTLVSWYWHERQRSFCFCLIQYEDTQKQPIAVTQLQGSRGKPLAHTSAIQSKNLGAEEQWRGRGMRLELPPPKPSCMGLYEAGRMAHQFRYFLNAEGPPGPADGEHAVPLNAQVVTDLATTKAELIKMGHQ